MPHLVAGVLLVVVCVGGSLWWAGNNAHREPVLAVARPVALGHVLVPTDLRSVDVSPAAGVMVIPAGQASSVVGRPMATSLGSGALLTPDAVGAAAIPVGRAVVAVGLEPGQFPPELAAGAAVAVVVTAAGTPGAGDQATAPGTSWLATILGVAPAGADSSCVVSLELDTASAAQLAQASAAQLALVLQPAGGGR
ncbi:hypothetical protein K1T34_47770 [Amycolatopsis sp. DSM 110486]|nr:hypothetical protein K1T34_47770 [Amycolatopsis sp. DSM 110486]